MKKNSIINTQKFLLAAFSFSLLFASCTKDFENINNDPNNPKNVPNSFYLAGAQRGIMDNTVDIWWGGNVGNQLAQYWSSNQYTSESRYNFRIEVTTTSWRNFYTGGTNDEDVIVGGLFELKKIVDNCTNEPGLSSASGDVHNQIAVATLLRVWLVQNMTDAWGDIPYSQALDPDHNRAPKYDRQADIYYTGSTNLLKEVSEALNNINTSAAGPVGDLVYGGDMTKWAKFGNALKMRIALRMVDRDENVAKTAFLDAVAAGTYTSNDDNALLHYGTSATSSNPVYNNYAVQGRDDYASSNVMMAVLDTGAGHSLFDPRLPCFFAPAEDTTNGVWVGEVYGLSEANGAATANSIISQRSPLILSATLPGIYMDYAQVEFMMAEASARGWAVSGTAEDHYKAGIQSSIEFWTALYVPFAPTGYAPPTQAEIDAYIAQDSVDYNLQLAAAPPSVGADKWKYPIGKQKWIALYNQGIQGWAEWRRLDFGILQLPADGVIDGTGIPFRMKYDVNEQTLNSGNYNAALGDQGPDLQDTRLWWDVH